MQDQYIINLFEKNKFDIIIKILSFINDKLNEKLIVKDNEKETSDNIFQFMTKLREYEQIRDYFKKIKIDIKEIEAIELKEIEINISDVEDSVNFK